MSDEVVDDPGPVDDDGAESEVEEVDETEDADSDDDAAAEEDEDDPAADDESDDSEDDDGKAPTKGRSAKLDKLLSKYGGDPDKMVDAYFEQANSMSKLYDKLSQLEVKLTAPKEDPEAEQKFVANDSEVKEYGQELQALNGELEQAQKSATGMVTEFGRLEKQIAKLEGQLEKAAVEDRAEIREQLNDSKADMKNLQRDWKDQQREMIRLQQQIRSTARNFRQAEANAKTRRETERQRESDTATAQRVTQNEFSNSVKLEAAKYGLDPTSKTYEVVEQSVRDQLVRFLQKLPKGTPSVNIPEAVAKMMAEYAEALELKGRFKQKSKAKQETRPAKGEPTGKGGKDSSKHSPKSAAYWKERARRLAG